MDCIDYQKYIYITYHLKSLLREWKQLKPSFASKFATVHRMSPQSKYLLILSLWQLSNRIRGTNVELISFLQQLHDICKTHQLDSYKLLYNPDMGVPLYDVACDIADDISFLQRKFEGGQTVPFKDLPYGFQTRLVNLIPPCDLINFKLAGKAAAKHVEKRGQFSAFLFVVRDSVHYQEIKTVYGRKPIYSISSDNCFLKSRCFVETGLCINMDSTEKFDRAVEIVYGTYSCLDLLGPYTWKHAVHLMNVSKEVKNVCMGYGMLLEEDDFDAFFEAVVQWLNHQEGARMIDIQCPYLTVAFNPQFKEYVENGTTFKVKFSNGYTVICKSPQKL
uniref:F-box only protein 22 n=1 Tax=Panagrellus redivivus TaxID=6233 RepID=A0A7E4VQN3_PANRE